MTNSQRALIEGLLTFLTLLMIAGLFLAFTTSEVLGLAMFGFGAAGVLSLCVAQWRLQRAPLD